MDYFKHIGELALSGRLKRIADSLSADAHELYAEQGLEFEPRWFPLFSLLSSADETSVTAAASTLRLTHPHVSLLTKEMAQAKLLSVRPDPADARAKILSLTAKGRQLERRLEPIWLELRGAARALLEETDPRLLETLAVLETKLDRAPLLQRVRDRQAAAKASERKPAAKLIDYRPSLKREFERLNRQWIDRYFELEDEDRRMFADPDGEIIGLGGDIVFAELEGEIVGVCALQRDGLAAADGGEFELAKLAVTDDAKGRGIGELLAREIMRRAREKGARRLRLTTHSSLTPALRLYEKLGFREVFRGRHPKLKRVDLVMEKGL